MRCAPSERTIDGSLGPVLDGNEAAEIVNGGKPFLKTLNYRLSRRYACKELFGGLLPVNPWKGYTAAAQLALS